MKLTIIIFISLISQFSFAVEVDTECEAMVENRETISKEVKLKEVENGKETISK